MPAGRGRVRVEMLFTQFEFILLFLPAVIFAHEILRSPAQRVRLLVLASVVFEGFGWLSRILPVNLIQVEGLSRSRTTSSPTSSV